MASPGLMHHARVTLGGGPGVRLVLGLGVAWAWCWSGRGWAGCRWALVVSSLWGLTCGYSRLTLGVVGFRALTCGYVALLGCPNSLTAVSGWFGVVGVKILFAL